ncbi:hemin uptake protein HemP [Mangrovicella endophytica]|uniref:hemin uptake protein HemP n=1 Tax=Mangrovicella endophytica TaxID=2066697 RepID=UPI000C9E8466|nr:hemin uptake protein HemP [Mangrovicella endophytica]
MVEEDGKRPSAEGAADPTHIRPPRERFSSSELFARGREVLIQHEDEVYRLRLTSKNKLILTK